MTDLRGGKWWDLVTQELLAHTSQKSLCATPAAALRISSFISEIHLYLLRVSSPS